MAYNIKGECRNTGRTHFQKGVSGFTGGHSESSKKAIGEATKKRIAEKGHHLKGKLVSNETKEKIRKSLLERNKSMIRNPECYPEIKDWKKITEAVFNRDNYQCQECGKKLHHYKTRGVVQCHHIDYDTSNNELSNLITLCASCHGKTGHRREEWIMRYNAKLKQPEFISSS